MKNVYLIQPNNLLSNEIFLPYAAGAIAAYAWQFEEIQREYALCDIFFMKEDIERVVERMDNPFFVGFSCYMWNVNYNLSLAQRIKEKYPQCIIALGGPQIPDDTEYMEQYPFIDLLMYGEGEITFYRLLQELAAEKNLSGIDNICFRQNYTLCKTPRTYNRDVSTFPSPYAAGVFDDIVNNPAYAHLAFSGVLETNRGCPYQCAYCYWAGTVKNFRQFTMEKVKADIDWIATHKITYILCADSNFGILPRDMEITEYIVAQKQKFGYPQKMETSSAKNKEETVFAINKKLQSGGLNCGISVAVQSMSPVVLKNIGRENISIDNFSQQLKKYRDVGMATYTDFILALPGETYESFMHGVFLAMEAGQHSSLNIHPCEVLPNTRLYSHEMREKFGILTVCSTLCQARSVYVEDNASGTRSEIIVATDTMSREDWVHALCFSIVLQVFHSFSLLRYIAFYLRKTEDFLYEDFYTALYERIRTNNAFIQKTMDKVFERIVLFSQGKSDFYYFNKTFSDSYLDFKEGLFLSFIQNKEQFFAEIKEYLAPFFTDREVFEDLFRYQYKKMKYPGCQPEELQFRYDWQSYFEGIIDKEHPVPQKKDIRVFAGACAEQTWREYTRNNIWYGKREQKMLRTFTRVQD